MLKFTKKQPDGQLLPAYPLFVKDPFFSIWSDNNKLNEADTIFWTGASKKMYGLIQVEGKTYSFMGLVPYATKLTQTYVDVTAFDTKYGFECEDFEFNVTFTSPLMPDDLVTMSSPVCYFRYTLIPKKNLGKTTVALFADENLCYDRIAYPIRGGKHVLFDKSEIAWMGLKKQLVMSQSYDDSSAEWGYWYLGGKKALAISKNVFDKFVQGESISFMWDQSCGKMICAYDEYETVDDVQFGMMTVSFDDTCSIFYFGQWLNSYYFDKTGNHIIKAIEEGIKKANRIFEKCENFDRKLKKMVKPYGDDYLLVLYAGLRQAVAGHKLVMDRKGNLLFLSKENHSNGCIGTVDVSYPSIPLFLLFNPDLVRAMCEPIFTFARMDCWTYDFTPHDVGTYPYCCGQVYGVGYRVSSTYSNSNEIKVVSEEFCADGSIFPSSINQPDIPYTYPLYYTYPAEPNIYKLEKQMPVEECGNMLIMVAAALLADGNKKMAKENWDLLTCWVKYLEKFGLMPGNQLCTDDFAGHLDKNINLSVKAIVGIEAYAIIADKLGYNEIGEKFHALAKDYSIKWKEMCFDGETTPLVFDGEKDTFSLKYNMAFDVIFGSNLFDADVREKEVDRYISLSNKYGVPLDSRSSYTKSDWILWATTLTSDIEKRKALIAPIAKFLKESPTRYPFTDWYYTDTGKIKGFINKWGRYSGFKNRTVQGGLFIPLLLDSGICKND